MQNLGKHDPLKRWPKEADGLQPNELVQLGTTFLQEAFDTPSPWTEVVIDDLEPPAWILQGDILDGIRFPIFSTSQVRQRRVRRSTTRSWLVHRYDAEL